MLMIVHMWALGCGHCQPDGADRAGARGAGWPSAIRAADRGRGAEESRPALLSISSCREEYVMLRLGGICGTGEPGEWMKTVARGPRTDRMDVPCGRVMVIGITVLQFALLVVVMGLCG